MAEPVFKLLRCDAEASHMLGWAKKEVRRLVNYASLDAFNRTWKFGDVSVRAQYFGGVARLWLEAEAAERLAVWVTLSCPTKFTTLFAQNVPEYNHPDEPPVPGPPGPYSITYSVFFQFFGKLPSGAWEGITHGPNWWERDGMSGTTTAEGTWAVVGGQPVFTPSGVYYTAIVGSLTSVMASPYVQVDLRTDTGLVVIEAMSIGNWSTNGAHDGSIESMRSALTAGLTPLIYPPAPPTYSRRAVITSAQEVLAEDWVQETGATYPAPYWDGRSEVLFYIQAGSSWRGPDAVWGPVGVPVDIPAECLPVADNPPPLPPVLTPGIFTVGEYVAVAALNNAVPSNIGVYTGVGLISMQRTSEVASYVRVDVGGQESLISGQCAVSVSEDAEEGYFVQERVYSRYVVDSRRLMSGVLRLRGVKQAGVFVAKEILADERTYEWLFLTPEFRGRHNIVYDNEKRMQEDMWLEGVYSFVTRPAYTAAANEFIETAQARTFSVPPEWETRIKTAAPIAKVKRAGSVAVGFSEELVVDTPERVERRRTVTITVDYPQIGETPAHVAAETIVGTYVQERTEHVKEAGYENANASPVAYSAKHTYNNWFVIGGWASDPGPSEVVSKDSAALVTYDLLSDAVEPVNRPAREVGLLYSGEIINSIGAPFAGAVQDNAPMYDVYTHYYPPKPPYTNTLRGRVPGVLRDYYRAVPQKDLGTDPEPSAFERYWLSSSLVAGSTCTVIFIAPILDGVSLGCFASRNDFQTTAEFEVVGTLTFGFSWETGRFSAGEWRAVGKRFVSHRTPANALVIYGGIKWDDVKEKAKAQRNALADPNDPAHDPLMKAVLDALTPQE